MQYLINSILLDKSNQHVFCITQHVIKLWDYYDLTQTTQLK